MWLVARELRLLANVTSGELERNTSSLVFLFSIKAQNKIIPLYILFLVLGFELRTLYLLRR
jgi:hypothetical protein